MYIREILKKFTHKRLKIIAKDIHTYFNLVSGKRIYELILQVDSIDTALWLLMCHKESSQSLDSIIYDYLHHKDNKGD